ncbi:MAG TPA: FtsX-like permease family protein, partial [Gemmatimonadales bacterium]|nr:FtsX-like permease family protein [Gemmatimonadales bacterium]
LGEAARRQGEIAARTALGASPGRLVRQLFTESLVIAGSGAFLGMMAGWALTRILVAMAPANIPGLSDVRFDLRVLGFTVACALVSGLASGVLPVVALLKWGRHPVAGAATGLTPRGEILAQRMLVGLEVALSLIMLVGCSLLGRSLIRLTGVDPGFVPEGLLTVELTAPRSLWLDSARVVSFTDQAVRELKALPGVASVSGSNSGLLNGNTSSSPIKVVGHPESEVRRDVQQRVVLADYFTTMRLPLVKGRDFSEADDHTSAPVAIISEAEVRRDFPGESPLGQRVVWQGQEWTVIGVAADVHYSGLDEEVQPTIYIPSRQWAGSWMSFLVRATGSADGALLMRAIKERLAGVDPTIAITGINQVPALVRKSYAEERYRTLLGTLFGACGTVLAAFGMFGVIARTVARRMREAGIRSALGAPAGSLTRLMLRETAIGAAAGIVVGVPMAAWLARGLTPYLFGVGAGDPVAYLGALGLFTLAAAMATLPAARRAARVDPARVLRAE